jgi:hypothetical protein
MRNLWAAMFSTWALFAVLAVLAWTRPLPAPQPGNVPSAVVLKDKNGKTHLVVVQGGAGASHATTRTSPVPAG